MSVVERDAALLQRGRDVRPKGANLVTVDLFDAGLLGDGVRLRTLHACAAYIMHVHASCMCMHAEGCMMMMHA